MPKNPVTPEGCLSAMLEHRRTMTMNKERTIDFYRETLQALFKIMVKTGCHMMPYKIKRGETEARYGVIDETDVKKILTYMDAEDYAIATRKGYVRALDHYCRHFENRVVADMKIYWPEDTRPNVDWLDMDQMRRLLEHPMNPMQELAVSLMGRMGLRRVECIRIRLKDISPTHISVRGKGPITGKMRNVPLRDGMQQMIDRYMRHREGLVAKARAKDPRTEVPDELFLSYNQGILRPYEEDGWGFDKAVIVPLRKELGFPFLEPYSEADVRACVMELRGGPRDHREDPRPHLDRDDDQVPRHRDGRHGGGLQAGAVLTG